MRFFHYLNGVLMSVNLLISQFSLNRMNNTISGCPCKERDGWLTELWYTGDPNIQVSVYTQSLNFIQHRSGPFFVLLSAVQGLFVLLIALRKKYSLLSVLCVFEVICNCDFILVLPFSISHPLLVFYIYLWLSIHVSSPYVNASFKYACCSNLHCLETLNFVCDKMLKSFLVFPNSVLLLPKYV